MQVSFVSQVQNKGVFRACHSLCALISSYHLPGTTGVQGKLHMKTHSSQNIFNYLWKCNYLFTAAE